MTNNIEKMIEDLFKEKREIENIIYFARKVEREALKEEISAIRKEIEFLTNQLKMRKNNKQYRTL